MKNKPKNNTAKNWKRTAERLLELVAKLVTERDAALEALKEKACSRCTIGDAS